MHVKHELSKFNGFVKFCYYELIAVTYHRSVIKHLFQGLAPLIYNVDQSNRSVCPALLVCIIFFFIPNGPIWLNYMQFEEVQFENDDERYDIQYTSSEVKSDIASSCFVRET